MERLVRVKVIPNSDRSSIEKKEDEIKVRVTSPAKRGKANRELLRILQEAFQTQDVQIVAGGTKRTKLVRIQGNPDIIDDVLKKLSLDNAEL